jgi:putative transposase
MPFLAEAPTHPLQQALKDVHRTCMNFLTGKVGFPRFRKKGVRESFRYPDPKQIKLDENNSRIFLPKLGWIRYRKSRCVEGEIKQVTVIQEAGKWYVSIQTERAMNKQKEQDGSPIGVDLGVAKFATVSDGTVYKPMNSYRKHAKKLAAAQRKLSKKAKRSANRQKQVRRIQKIHKKISDIRRDFLHKTSTAISKNHALVIIEDLNVKGMSASASGTNEKPGKAVRAKSGLNKSILDQGWGEFRRQLQYKLDWLGGKLISVPSKNTSIKCSDCKHTSQENRRTQSVFCCVKCGYRENADLNAAKNILAAGRAVIACGEIRRELYEAGTTHVRGFAAVMESPSFRSDRVP